MMKKDKIYKEIRRMMGCLIVVLLALGVAERVMAEAPASEREKIHIVDLPVGAEPFLWSKGNKDGVRVVLLAMAQPEGSDPEAKPQVILFNTVVLVRKDGTIVGNFKIESSRTRPANDDQVEFIWLSDSSFASVEAGKELSRYCIYIIDWTCEDTRPYKAFTFGEIPGRAQFAFKDGVFCVTKDNNILIKIPLQHLEPYL